MHFLDGSIQTKLLELKASEGPPTSSETSSLVQQPQYQSTSTQQLFAKCIIYIVLFSFLASFARRLLLLFPFYKKETETQKAGTPAPSFSSQEEAELGSVSLTSASTFIYLFIFCCTASMQDLTSPTRDQTYDLYSRSCCCCSVTRSCSDSLGSHGLQHARLPNPSQSHRACSDSCPLNQSC